MKADHCIYRIIIQNNCNGVKCTPTHILCCTCTNQISSAQLFLMTHKHNMKSGLKIRTCSFFLYCVYIHTITPGARLQISQWKNFSGKPKNWTLMEQSSTMFRYAMMTLVTICRFHCPLHCAELQCVTTVTLRDK